MGHEHTHKHEIKEGKNLFITVLLNFLISFVEIAGGIFSNSLSLISDALHNFSDGFAMLIAYVALKVSKKDPNFRKTFGYQRVQILAALFNSATLIIICIFLLYEAYQRFLSPEEIKSMPMMIVATIGLAANLIGVFLLKAHSKDNLNIKSAYLHLIGDTFSSVAVIIGGILIYYFQIQWIDPLITVLISIYIIKETISILLETYNILMQSTPKGIDILKLTQEIQLIEQVEDIHHVHIWSLSDKETHFEAHINLSNDLKISECEQLIKNIESVLHKNYQINHVTLQMEYGFCDNKTIISNNH